MKPSLVLDLPMTGPSGVFVVLFVVVLVLPLLAEKVRLPGLVGLTIGGVVVGPFGLGLIERDGTVALLGGAGLLFLMFEAGLELDRDVLAQERRGTIVFGVLTFALPFLFGVIVHRWLGYPWLAALLLASCWSSHTLLAYPVFQRARVTGNRAVTVALGGTVITDTAALLFLVAVARFEVGDLDWLYVATSGPLLVLAGCAILFVLPRLAAWFFASIGQERSARFLFVMVALFGSSGLAELAGVEPIIGAFLAGLAMNRVVVPGGALAGQVRFFGSNLLTPMFMISVGMLIDPALLFSDTRTLVRGVGFTGAVVAGKALAAFIAGRSFGWRRAEIAALFSLSVAQAAATLAAVFVGFEIGVLDESTVNAVILVILVTCVIASLVGDVVTSRLPPPPPKTERMGRRVLMPLSATPLGQVIVRKEESDAQVRVASAVAAADAGTVLSLAVAGLATSAAEIQLRREHLVDHVERTVLAQGAEAESSVRLDSSTAAGVLHAATEHDVTCIVAGWKGWSTRRESFFGESIDALLASSMVPVLIVRAASVALPARRLVLVLDDQDGRLDHQSAVLLAAATIDRLAVSYKLPVVVCASPEISTAHLAADLVGLLRGDAPRAGRTAAVSSDMSLSALIREQTGPGDVIVKALASTRAGLGNRFVRQAKGLDDRTIVAVSPGRASPNSR